jgi:hypothetical protein
MATIKMLKGDLIEGCFNLNCGRVIIILHTKLESFDFLSQGKHVDQWIVLVLSLSLYGVHSVLRTGLAGKSFHNALNNETIDLIYIRCGPLVAGSVV